MKENVAEASPAKLFRNGDELTDLSLKFESQRDRGGR